ncbi:MAG: hypothetical protein HC912_07110 [Saprospiraceae bacterium]|nr:hypothetical protein [Saprospiraceae bacterium]
MSFNSDRLVVNARKGINFQNNTTSSNTNSMINGLGVAFDANNAPFTIKTTVVNPYTDSDANAEQAGVWFGLMMITISK